MGGGPSSQAQASVDTPPMNHARVAFAGQAGRNSAYVYLQAKKKLRGLLLRDGSADDAVRATYAEPDQPNPGIKEVVEAKEDADIVHDLMIYEQKWRMKGNYKITDFDTLGTVVNLQPVIDYDRILLSKIQSPTVTKIGCCRTFWPKQQLAVAVSLIFFLSIFSLVFSDDSTRVPAPDFWRC